MRSLASSRSNRRHWKRRFKFGRHSCCWDLHYDIAAPNLLVSHDGESVWWIDFDVRRTSVQWDIPEAEFGEEMAKAKMQLKQRVFSSGLAQELGKDP